MELSDESSILVRPLLVELFPDGYYSCLVIGVDVIDIGFPVELGMGASRNPDLTACDISHLCLFWAAMA